MTTDEFVRLLSAKGRHPKWRSKCPVHKSRGLTLAIYQDADGIGLHCHAGCLKDDILKALGLSWRDLKISKTWLPPEEYKEMLKAKRKAEYEDRQLKRKIRYWEMETLRWTVIASMLDTLMEGTFGTPQDPQTPPLWKLARRALATARYRHSKLVGVYPLAAQWDVELYRCTKIPSAGLNGGLLDQPLITAKHVGPEIAVALGLTCGSD